MRIIQIIDSLEAGGAERMAVHYANTLTQQIDFSGLVVTRKEGPLLNQIEEKVSYLFLNKKRAIDFEALMRLRSYVNINKITIVHAHSTSFFLAFLLKVTCPSVQLIWHDHYGDSEFLSKRPTLALRLIIPFFNGIIAVNQNLKKWSEQKLRARNVLFLPNFPSTEKSIAAQTVLKGKARKQIVSLANLRVQKDHFLVLEVAKKLKISHPEWTFHLVGKDFEDAYSQKIKDLIIAFGLEKNVFLYGTKPDVGNILEQAAIGILTSQSEGLPVSLLEYGWYKKPVVVTNVGEIASLVENDKNGFLVGAQQSQLFYDSIVKLIQNEMLRSNFGAALHEAVIKNNSKEAVVKQYINWLQNSCK
ncbi:glycosyltransferase involved in cell wall biosynthesis [Flavobacterium sp. CG_9.1]|uniref:glycosyltransferase family 4 protein n=1 Tax=Flavobacterium sp. CG_9.1 TaxID=2787728 RepID=UPI0018C8E92A|nr:glycosyltransferase family 4 protein [Flavobacterium sp. CG_9.1]MBG6061037.1 glycosyltransferase involved in cell wall biosynthesis [Flavobacterium sp. CG_9.1]